MANHIKLNQSALELKVLLQLVRMHLENQSRDKINTRMG
jgi:hypothetical protein